MNKKEMIVEMMSGLNIEEKEKFLRIKMRSNLSRVKEVYENVYLKSSKNMVLKVFCLSIL